ncbi:MAG TPA: xanthine dehydrogenase family protein molybdopterin-binding subunit [Chloroflexaceae bacterium]|nr:xanthine dehydrogenase family protein molybdopterin-binding subunit [Chloroflexaceae bacterium]
MPIERVEKQGDGDQAEYTVVEGAELEPWGQGAPLRVVGRPHPRVEGDAKVTGRARYTYDVRLPGQLYARVLRSPHPHARVVRLDTSRAEALPGVHAVLSAFNTPEIPWYEESRLFDRTVRFVGDEVAALAAESEELAEDALRLIAVEYEPLPLVGDMEAALRPGAPALHGDSNVAGEPKSYSRGDLEAGLREAEVVIEQTYTTQTALHNAFEPHGSTAVWEGEELVLYCSTQSVWSVREELAEKLGLPAHRVRVIKEHMGGGFGAKQVAWKPDAIAALLAKAAGRPVQLMHDRSAENLAAGNRNATRQTVRLGARRDGRLTAIEARITQEVGAYMTGGEASDVSGAYQTLYRCPNVRTEQVGVYTNAGPAVAFRAPGHVEAAFALEQAMDELARALAMDPIALRERNYTEVNQQKGKPYTSPDSLRRCYEAVAERFGWASYRRPAPDGPRRRGVGFAAHDWAAGGGHPPGYASIQLNGDGSAEVITATQDIGTGTRTGLLMVAAEELGLPLERLSLRLGDTARGPYSPASAGSATQATLGPAVRAAAIEVKRQLCLAAAPILEEEPEGLVVRDGMVRVAAQPDSAVSIAEVAQRIAPHMIQGQGARGPNPEDKAIRTVGAQCVEVEVDVETGEVTVLRVAAAHDVGRIINPTMVESQVIGGVTQGIGYALTEERVVDWRRGLVLNANLEEYHVPTVADIPPITLAPLDMPDVEANATGAKGAGEPPLIPTAPAIANAVFDAVGVRVRGGPLSRRHVLEALAAQRDGQKGGAA